MIDMGRIEKTKKKDENVNISNDNKTFIYIGRKKRATDIDVVVDWSKTNKIYWTKYQIKESDMRIKTATFTTNQYLDLTTGQYIVLITSPYHEDFGGIILSVEEDDKTNLYTYKCQDFSRTYQSKTQLILSDGQTTIYNALIFLICKGNIGHKNPSKKDLNRFKNVLSGLRPAWQYWERAWGGILNYNFMTQKKKMVIRNKSYIEAIRDIVFGLTSFVDVYFDKYGIMHIEPFVKKDWLNTGLYITTPELSSIKHKFDTTNIVTGTIVHATDKKNWGKYYSAIDVFNLKLSLFFGDFVSSVENPNQAKTNANKTNSKTSNVKKDNVYGTRQKNVYLNTDSIDSYSADMGRMQEMKKILEKNGWNVTIAGVGSEAHYERRGEVKNGIWFCLYGGACAGTLREHCTSDWFLNPLKSNHSRVVVGFFPPSGSILKGGKYYSHLGPAWDWQGSSSYANIDYPGKFMSKNGIPWMYANNASEMASKFLAGGDNFATTGNSYNYYDSWQKHNPNWL